MIIQIANKIYIKDPHQEVMRAIKNNLTLPNPVYQVMKRKNPRACYALKKDFLYWSGNNEVMAVGRGNMKLILDACKGIGDKCDIKYQEKLINDSLSERFVSDKLVLREYQEGIPEKIVAHKNGVVNLGTGYGKTIISLKMIELLQKKTLIIVPRSSILEQFKKEIKKFYGIDCGIIQGTKWDIKDITVASISTLQKRDLSEIKDKFGMVIVDEAHTMITDARLAVIQTFNPAYLYGLTATPRRTDQQGGAIFFTFGDIIIEDKLPSKSPQVLMQNTGVAIPVQEYADMVTYMVTSPERNSLIVDFILDEIVDERKLLVLSKRIEHFEIIKEFLLLADPSLKIHSMSSRDKQSDRDELLLKLRDGDTDFDIIMGTMSLLGTGTDIPALDTLALIGDLKSDVLTEQSAGRILRIFKGKKEPLIIDFVDNLNPIFYRHAKARRKFYTDMGWEIV